MKEQLQKAERRERRRRRSKRHAFGTEARPRLVVYRSLSHIYGQLVDDVSGKTLVTASSSEKAIAPKSKKPVTKTELSFMVGKELAARAKKKKISKVVFDRNGFLYHGRVKAFADGAREGGLKF
ncbi:MAG: 50S ribosomal protein L18 [Candidatus Marinimicrobia bacterium]|jgi:large subunit ribosomal protein L18|nr:50S ribosomal protein L18 [Candidatus Neomarinimicrobiota bacterium]MDP6297124.1 50S ribosomal protein L18 [Candidatus Neomarinimicrobiota bacterium]MDP7122573.1 50S ribosomal protein L18 [Candidatus Neomarinimicrobiota bacterium]MDP7483551.1 50S ribosomal protein L18 [Candidatus Neomarinimicrobiota bacterium]MDP7528060.1 50S ribosomal protein L18 [Candidatus Neomarinimicrobiota bacterium]|tara:strand:+ start:3785 stop:4156 length:372 start_codon:yes stop_codon:yes gene_type:complete